MATKRAFWNKFGKYFGATVIAAFFLPFFGVSCEGMDVVTVSGADMVGGCKPGGLIAEAEKEQERDHSSHPDDTTSHGHHGGMSGMDAEVGNVDREPLAIVALGLAVLVFGASWVRSRKGMQASLGLSIATIAVLVALYFKIGGDLKDAIAKETLGKEQGLKHDVKVSAGGRYGLWLEGLLLVSIVALTGRALREPEMPGLPPAAPPPPAV
jgi:hypothetical protein